MSLGTVVEWGDLLQVVWASLLAGLGVTFAFSLALLGATRAVDLRRDGHTGAASVFVVVMAIGLIATAAAIVFGIVVMTSKD
jgi:hypothetical protein